MASTANQDAYGPAGWQGSNPWHDRRGDRWTAPGDGTDWAPPYQRWPWLSGPTGIAIMVLGFIVFWPVGLAILFYLIGSGRMSCRKRWNRNAWQDGPWNTGGGWTAWKGWAFGGDRAPRSSGNHAFDEYRAETLRRLEEEQKEFDAFLERLRFARDKAEFDQFMNERRGRPTSPPPTAGDQPAA